MFTLITPDGQSTSQGLLKNDTNNNNNNDRNNNKSKLQDKLADDDDGNNNGHSKRQQLLQRYSLDNVADHSAVHHSHHLLLLQQQQQQMNGPQMGGHMDGKSNLIPVPENSPSLIVLQPSAQSAGYSPFFNHYATGKLRFMVAGGREKVFGLDVGRRVVVLIFFSSKSSGI